ncbi:MAG: sensor histidine kinase [Candidatus Tyrphobacter sp.]
MAFLCYALLVCAWIVDLFTPQLFIAAILLNGPIALSSLALDRRLTTSLMIVAQVANITAGYVNGVQSHGHWGGIAVGDRILCALSFVLVGSLSIKTQGYAREAGESSLRARQVEREHALREAIAGVRASLNLELVLRALVRESVSLLSASRGMIVLRSGFEMPSVLSYVSGRGDVDYERTSLQTEIATLVERARERGIVAVNAGDPLGRLTLAALGARQALAVTLRADDPENPVLVLASGGSGFDDDAFDTVRRFAEQGEIALGQAQLFTRLGQQNQEILQQRDEIARRGDIIRDIVYALAHDLRTPLAATDVTMKQALNGAYGELPERYRDVITTTLASNADERRLLETLLLVARYESGEASDVREPFDCNALALRVATEIEPVAQAKNVTIASETAAEPVYVEGDEGELRRALGNLAANAIAATPAGGHVVIESAARNRRATLTVRDDGYGIPEKRRSNLFERFAARGPGGGSGLGLYIVRRIAEKHGGSVAYTPREPGSEFTLTLERCEPPRA